MDDSGPRNKGEAKEWQREDKGAEVEKKGEVRAREMHRLGERRRSVRLRERKGERLRERGKEE